MAETTIAVIGTDTGVGKTLAARSLLDFFRAGGQNVGAIKPFISGIEGTRWPDLDALGIDPLSTPARYRLPLSPYGAIRRGEDEIDLEEVRAHIDSQCRSCDVAVIEGIGGVLVPVARGMTWLDLHTEYGWRSVLVARAGLGTINHALLTAEACAARGISIAGFILNAVAPVAEVDAEENAAIIREFTGLACLGLVPHATGDTGSAWSRSVDWTLLDHAHAAR